MPAKFPKRRADGTFSARVVLTGAVDVEAVDRWLGDWIEANAKWERHWSSGRVEVLLLSDAFSSPPRRIPSPKNELWLRLDGTSAALFWKDWYARLVGDLTGHFPGLHLDRVDYILATPGA